MVAALFRRFTGTGTPARCPTVPRHPSARKAPVAPIQSSLHSQVRQLPAEPCGKAADCWSVLRPRSSGCRVSPARRRHPAHPAGHRRPLDVLPAAHLLPTLWAPGAHDSLQGPLPGPCLANSRQQSSCLCWADTRRLQVSGFCTWFTASLCCFIGCCLLFPFVFCCDPLKDTVRPSPPL